MCCEISLFRGKYGTPVSINPQTRICSLLVRSTRKRGFVRFLFGVYISQHTQPAIEQFPYSGGSMVHRSQSTRKRRGTGTLPLFGVRSLHYSIAGSVSSGIGLPGELWYTRLYQSANDGIGTWPWLEKFSSIAGCALLSCGLWKKAVRGLLFLVESTAGVTVTTLRY